MSILSFCGSKSIVGLRTVSSTGISFSRGFATLSRCLGGPTPSGLNVPSAWSTGRNPLLQSHPMKNLNSVNVNQIRTAVYDLRPKTALRRKHFKGFFKLRQGGSLKGTTCYRGDYGLRTIDGARISDIQMENCLIVIRRVLKENKGSKVYMRMTASRSVSQKPLQTRMGRGKGEIDYYACWVSPGRVLFEVKGLSELAAKKALTAAASCLPVRTRIVKAIDSRRKNPAVLPHFITKRIQNNNVKEI